MKKHFLYLFRYWLAYVKASIVSILTITILYGCAYFERQDMSSFEPFYINSDQVSFRFRAETSPSSTSGNDDAGEATRMEWLEHYLRVNNLCPLGYKIIERKVVVKRQTLLGPTHTIYYIGNCSNKPSLGGGEP